MQLQLVVGAAVVRAGRVLAARRTAPASAAGRWEFPGGKVDPGETLEQALVREIGEELGVTVRLDRWLAGEQPIGAYVLRVALCVLEHGEPTPTEHDRLRWLAAGELDDVDWLDGDRPFLSELSAVLTTLET
ncbi:(deoxy)nucleoside triphosphate pyrophosphohydrolase [Nocardioides anomalus]|uniref:8-oxo-dGTP diphosphatase n=1 Tax=Nocardioides anomalus TaxID=2712223 RepID=A0A6G6WG95_9ACTN|nr:(deoxy)nucleoside triphosphate pyrophosphohydrolase [Nocardioides anomalus]QIG44254.1 (deoxy)nucleoside triphosphate pyrophosphohydrolase [Nocardioides anomalus]